MKKIRAIILFLSAGLTGSVLAQCTSTASTYDLIVTDYVALAPNGAQFISGYVCTGATLVDSTMCCTRVIYVEQGGTYEAGPMAYGFVYLKNGATFDAHGNTNFFGVVHEDGAIILNYSGAQTLCTVVDFPSANCATRITENQAGNVPNVYPNPTTGFLNMDMPGGIKSGTITIYASTGEQVMKTTAMNEPVENTIDVSALLPGIYIYSIIGNNSLVTQGKFIVAEE